jgi:hypothetical protein
MGIAGGGWRVDGLTDGISLEEYESAYEALMDRTNTNRGNRAGWKAAINAIGRDMLIDDLVWARNNAKIYYLGRITSGWSYKASAEYADADIVNVRDCDWHPITDKNIVIPQEVVDSFDGRGHTVERIHNNGEWVTIESQRIYNRVSNSNFYRIEA